MRKTRWYPAHIKPVRKGWYEVKGCDECYGQHYWNGCFWEYFGDPVLTIPWRGLLINPPTIGKYR